MPRTVCFRTKGQDFSRVNFDFCTFFIATQLSKSQLDQSPYVIRSFIVLKSAFHCLPTTVILRKTVFSTSLLVQWFYISLFSLLPFRDIAMKKWGEGNRAYSFKRDSLRAKINEQKNTAENINDVIVIK